MRGRLAAIAAGIFFVLVSPTLATDWVRLWGPMICSPTEGIAAMSCKTSDSNPADIYDFMKRLNLDPELNDKGGEVDVGFKNDFGSITIRLFRNRDLCEAAERKFCEQVIVKDPSLDKFR
jgi:hypothetical protein